MKLKVRYTINHNLLQCLMQASGHSKNEVCAHLQDLAHKCFKEMNDTGNETAWAKVNYPKPKVFLRINVVNDCRSKYPYSGPKKGKIEGIAVITLWDDDTYFSNKQVEEFLAEKILLGAKG
jgi:hypothetical protein